MSDGLWNLVITLGIGYLIYRAFLRRRRRPRLGVLQGGRVEDGQFQTTGHGPPDAYEGNPQISVLTWPNAGSCKC